MEEPSQSIVSTANNEPAPAPTTAPASANSSGFQSRLSRLRENINPFRWPIVINIGTRLFWYLHSFVMDPAKARGQTVLIMQLLAMTLIIWNGNVLFNELEWNAVVDGRSAINMFGSEKYLDVDFPGYYDNESPEVKNLLKRQVGPLITSLILLASLLAFNVVTLGLEKWRKRCLNYAAIGYALLGLSLQIVAMFQIVTAFYNHRNEEHDSLLQEIVEALPEGENRDLPTELPQDETISFRDNVAFFHQVFESCRQGDVSEWKKKSEDLKLKDFKIPSYSQLVDMGFCIDEYSNVACSVIIFSLLSPLIWWNACMCLTIWLEIPPANLDVDFGSWEVEMAEEDDEESSIEIR